MLKARLLEPSREEEPPPLRKTFQTLFFAMVEIEELMAVRLGPKKKLMFTSSPGHASMPPALQFVYLVLVLIAESSGLRTRMAAPNREMERKNLGLLRSDLAASWTDIFQALKSFYEFADILIVFDEVLCLEVSNLVRQLKFKPEINDKHGVINQLIINKEITIVGSTSS